MRPQPLICVRDVEASSRWHQRLLGCESAHGGPNYERLVHSGELVMQLHRWEVEHHHGPIGDRSDMPPGNGLLLWFEVDDCLACAPLVLLAGVLAFHAKFANYRARAVLLLEQQGKRQADYGPLLVSRLA